MRADEVTEGAVVLCAGAEAEVASVVVNEDGSVLLVFAAEITTPDGTGVVSWHLAADDEVEVA